MRGCTARRKRKAPPARMGRNWLQAGACLARPPRVSRFPPLKQNLERLTTPLHEIDTAFAIFQPPKCRRQHLDGRIVAPPTALPAAPSATPTPPRATPPCQTPTPRTSNYSRKHRSRKTPHHERMPDHRRIRRSHKPRPPRHRFSSALRRQDRRAKVKVRG